MNDLGPVFEAILHDLGVAGEEAKAELAAYAAERTAHLSLIAAEPGFSEAVKAERDNVAMKAAELLVALGDTADVAQLSVLEGAMSALARAMASQA